jgi:hypothetical protein
LTACEQGIGKIVGTKKNNSVKREVICVKENARKRLSHRVFRGGAAYGRPFFQRRTGRFRIKRCDPPEPPCPPGPIVRTIHPGQVPLPLCDCVQSNFNTDAGHGGAVRPPAHSQFCSAVYFVLTRLHSFCSLTSYIPFLRKPIAHLRQLLGLSPCKNSNEKRLSLSRDCAALIDLDCALAKLSAPPVSLHCAPHLRPSRPSQLRHPRAKPQT